MSNTDRSRVVAARFVAAAQSRGSLPPPTSLEVAFAGRSNVGKSSLLNCLLQRKNLVRTSSTPGCTRQITFFEAELADGPKLYLVDLPGFGYAKRSKAERASWADMIEAYLTDRVSLAAIVVLVDVRRGPESDERQLAELLQHVNEKRGRPIEIFWVATKLDRLSKSQQKTTLKAAIAKSDLKLLGFSAKDGTGREALWDQIRQALSLS